MVRALGEGGRRCRARCVGCRAVPDLVRAHYNSRLVLGGVIVNHVERTVEHRAGVKELASYFGAGLVWLPHLPKRTALQQGARRGVPVSDLGTRAARELGHRVAELANCIEMRGAA